MQDKWNIKKKKGYLKIHIAVDVKTKEILALEVTDEKVHDGRKIMPKLIEYILKNNNHIKIKSALNDGSYDGNGNFKYLQNKRILPAIKVRKNSIITRKNNSLRNREVYSQLKDLLKWKRRRTYGKRWMARNCIFLYKAHVWRICVCDKISKYDKRDDIKSIFCTTCLEALYKMYGNNLRKTSYATEHFTNING